MFVNPTVTAPARWAISMAWMVCTALPEALTPITSEFRSTAEARAVTKS